METQASTLKTTRHHISDSFMSEEERKEHEIKIQAMKLQRKNANAYIFSQYDKKFTCLKT